MSYKDATHLLGRIESEGGVIETARYGITHCDVPPEVAEEWEELESLLLRADELEAAITARLEISSIDAERQDEIWEEEFGDGDDVDEEDE